MTARRSEQTNARPWDWTGRRLARVADVGLGVAGRRNLPREFGSGELGTVLEAVAERSLPATSDGPGSGPR